MADPTTSTSFAAWTGQRWRELARKALERAGATGRALMLTVLNVGFPSHPSAATRPAAPSRFWPSSTRRSPARVTARSWWRPKARGWPERWSSTPGCSGAIDDAARAAAHAGQRQAIAAALDRWPVDLVHLHGIDFAAYLPPPGLPALVTLHLPLAWYGVDALRPHAPRDLAALRLGGPAGGGTARCAPAARHPQRRRQ